METKVAIDDAKAETKAVVNSKRVSANKKAAPKKEMPTDKKPR